MKAADKYAEYHSAYARFDVVETPRGRVRRGSTRCVINHHIAIDAEALSSYCFRRLPKLVDDLVLITAVVAFADRTVARRAAHTWRRFLDLTIPVHQLDYWQQPAISTALAALLQLLTGDVWVLHFRPRLVGTPTRVQAPLSLSHGMKPIVMPFSDGLDSLAGARLIAAAEANAPLILVTAGQRKDADREWRERQLNARRCRLVLPFRFRRSESGHRLREQSYRSRALVYGTMAAIAAHLSEGERVIYTESGQGTLGPWLVPVGNEAPDIRMNPLFTSRLARFLATVLGTPIKFEHPRLWSTKGETLRELVAIGRADDWYKTRSCARDARHLSISGRLPQCGVCAGCLLRRQSLLAASLDEQLEQSPYFWRNLNADSLQAAASSRARPTKLNDKRQAVCGFLALAQLADLADPASKPGALDVSSRELAEVLNESEQAVNARLKDLLTTHRSEWMNFLERLGKGSFLNEWTRERR